MKIERIAEMAITDADEAQINCLLIRAFQEGFGDRSYHQQRHHMRFVMRDGDAVIGHMALCYRSIRMGDVLIRIAGLGEVATDPDHQGRGIASALMADALDVVRQSQAEFFILFGDRPLYAGHGFRSAPNPVTHVEMYHARTGQVVTTAQTDLMILPLGGRAWDDAMPIDLLGHMF